MVMTLLQGLYEQSLLPLLGYLALGVPFALVEWKFFAQPVQVRRRLWRDLGACCVVFVNGLGITFVAWQGVINPLRLTERFSATLALPLWLRLLIAPIAADFSLYWLHRALHSRWLWPVHRWHHAPSELYWLSGIRASFPQNLLYLLVPLCWAIALHLPWELFPLGAVGAVLVNNFMHWNVRLRVPWLERFVVTPRVHRVHHLRAGPYGNFGAFFAWDRLFGTWRDPDTAKPDAELGIPDEAHALSLWSGL